jgi:tetratricopeptide (TPR) repeat protein
MENPIRLPTMYIKNCRNNSKIKQCSPNQLCRELENECFEIGNFSYTERYASFETRKKYHMKKILTILMLTISAIMFGQSQTDIDNIIQLGDQWKFEEAIKLLKNEIANNPENPELYYWLGRYSHYIVYDTRPFSNKSDQWSKNQVLKNLQKAVELDPDFGDAKYFLAAEYGARALEAVKDENLAQYRKELIDAKKWGGFPTHAIENGKNILRSCENNAILIVNGDAQFNVLQYIQVIEGFRKDVSLIVLALLERPYYIKLIRDGVPGIYKPVHLNMNDNLVMEMHNYKWKENDVIIPISQKSRKEYNLSDTVNQFKWHIKPNVGKNKLWTGTAILINLIESNNWIRPIFYTWFGLSDLDGLENNMQITGLTAKIHPLEVKGTVLEYDIKKFESVMLDPENYKEYQDIAINNQPRVSYAFGNLSRRRIVDYAYFLHENNETEKAKTVLEKMMELMPTDIHPLSSDIENDLSDLMNELEKNE